MKTWHYAALFAAAAGGYYLYTQKKRPVRQEPSAANAAARAIQNRQLVQSRLQNPGRIGVPYAMDRSGNLVV